MESPLELGDWIPKALPRTSNISIRVSTRFQSCGPRQLARKFTPWSCLLPGAAFPGSSLWDALHRRSPNSLSIFVWTRISPGAQGRAHVWLVPACPLPFLLATEWQWCYPWHMLWVTACCLFPIRFLWLSSSSREYLCSIVRRKCGKLGSTLCQYQ